MCIRDRRGRTASADAELDMFIALSCSTDHTVRIVAVASGEWVRVLEGHTKPPIALASTADGRTLLSAGGDGTVRVWDATHRGGVRRAEGHTNWVWAVGISADGRRVASAGADGTVRVWDALSGACERTLAGAHADGVRALAISADGRRIASGGMDGFVKLWSARTGKCEMAVGSGAAQVAVRAQPPAAGAAVPVPTLERFAGVAAAAGCGEPAAVGTASTAARADAPSSAATGRSLVGQSLSSLAFSADGALLACAHDDGRLLLVDAASGVRIGAPLHAQHGVTPCASLSKDGRVLLSGGHDRAICVWDARARVLVRTLRSHTDHVLCVDAGVDGSSLVSGSADGMLLLWQAARGDQPRALRGHRAAVYAVARTADGVTIVSASADLTARVWSAVSGACERVLEGHSQWVVAVAVSADGSTIATGSIDNTVRVWTWADDGDADGPPPPLLREADRSSERAQQQHQPADRNRRARLGRALARTLGALSGGRER